VKLRYTVYDTWRGEYLRELLLMRTDTGGSEVVGMEGTRRAAEAMRFPGVKSARQIIGKLGGGAEYVVINAKGDICG
jgi:hypothetical protein